MVFIHLNELVNVKDELDYLGVTKDNQQILLEGIKKVLQNPDHFAKSPSKQGLKIEDIDLNTNNSEEDSNNSEDVESGSESGQKSGEDSTTTKTDFENELTTEAKSTCVETLTDVELPGDISKESLDKEETGGDDNSTHEKSNTEKLEEKADNYDESLFNEDHSFESDLTSSNNTEKEPLESSNNKDNPSSIKHINEIPSADEATVQHKATTVQKKHRPLIIIQPYVSSRYSRPLRVKQDGLTV